MKVTLTRHVQNDEVTFGTMRVGDVEVFTVEKPWLYNEKNISCIPDGVYALVKCHTSKTMPREYRGNTYEVEDVPGRSLIKIHVANYPHELQGCIAPCLGIDLSLVMGTKSTAATQKFMDAMGGVEEATLTIRTV